MKTCNKCKETKELDEFVKDSKNKDGRGTICKECTNLAARIRRHQAKYKTKFVDSKIIKKEKEEILSKGFKMCTKCNEIKNISEFTIDNRAIDGLCNICKSCKNSKAKERYEMIKNDETFHTRKLISSRKYKELHKEKLQESWTEYNNRPDIKNKKLENYRIQQNRLTPNDRLKELIRRAKQRSLRKNLIFSLSENDLELIEYCPILGIKLNWDGGPRNKYTPSLDKIIPELGYIKDNVRIISNFANIMKNSASVEELQIFSENILKYMNNEEIVRTIENRKSIELEDKELLG